MKNLQETPHGGASLYHKGCMDEDLLGHNIPNTTIVHGGDKGEMDLIGEWGLAVWYPNQRDVRSLPHAAAGEDSLLTYALEKPSRLVVDKARNGQRSETDTNRRIRFGCGQNQRTTYERYRCFDKSTHKVHKLASDVRTEDRVNCPTIDTRAYHNMPRTAKEFIRNVARLGKAMVKRYHGRAALNDKERNIIFSKALSKELCWRADVCAFEYIDIQIMSEGVVLYRHMDYKNDSRIHYNHTFVYSFFREIKGVEYKVSIVMTTRCDAGSFMDRIRGLKK